VFFFFFFFFLIFYCVIKKVKSKIFNLFFIKFFFFLVFGRGVGGKKVNISHAKFHIHDSKFLFKTTLEIRFLLQSEKKRKKKHRKLNH